MRNRGRRIMWDERASECGKHLRPGSNVVGIHARPGAGTARFSGLATCGAIWMCPVCAARITEQRREELSIAVKRCGMALSLATFTVSHKMGESCSEVKKRVLGAWTLFASRGSWFGDKRAAYGIAHWVRSVEVTWGANGWHVHLHVLMLHESQPGADDVAAMESEFKAKWSVCVDRAGGSASWEYGCDVRAGDEYAAVYIAKYGREPEEKRVVGERWTVIHELVKSGSKRGRADASLTPFELLELEDKRADRLFREYAKAMKGTRQLTWSHGFREAVGLGAEQDDAAALEAAEAAEAAEVEVLIGYLARADWYLLNRLHRESRVDPGGRLLSVAALGDADVVDEWLYHAIDLGELLEVDDERLNAVSLDARRGKRLRAAGAPGAAPSAVDPAGQLRAAGGAHGAFGRLDACPADAAPADDPGERQQMMLPLSLPADRRAW